MHAFIDKFQSNFNIKFLIRILFMHSVIEHLPQELRDRFTEMREMDLQVHSKQHICISSSLLGSIHFQS